ncbi:hypothetical protein BDW72DRAFT_198708 [Aspergillus terricola var. indicus]
MRRDGHFIWSSLAAIVASGNRLDAECPSGAALAIQVRGQARLPDQPPPEDLSDQVLLYSKTLMGQLQELQGVYSFSIPAALCIRERKVSRQIDADGGDSEGRKGDLNALDVLDRWRVAKGPAEGIPLAQNPFELLIAHQEVCSGLAVFVEDLHPTPSVPSAMRL